MNPISESELAQIRADAVAATCDKVCVIQRKATTSGTTGEPLGEPVPIATTVAGLAEPTAGQLTNYDFLIGSLAAWQVKLPVGTNIMHQDQLIVDSQTLEVQVILNPRSYASLLTVLASEVK